MSNRRPITGLVLDTGALLAVERADRRVRELLRRAERHAWPLTVPAGVLARAWRGGPRQARVARLLAQSEVAVAVLDEQTAKSVGQVCGISGHADVVDVHVALQAKELGHHVVTSDPGDIRALDPTLPIIPI